MKQGRGASHSPAFLLCGLGMSCRGLQCRHNKFLAEFSFLIDGAHGIVAPDDLDRPLEKCDSVIEQVFVLC